mmetsp:Transcript_55654/g.62276  ORF Transcript_55654/g.62276 Transcript_55654/m.62276 type:complete len:349 (+) Transcript_55654:80-1126(+)
MFESEETSMAVDPVLTSTSTNTKSKKKRNRKKKKKGATSSTASTNTTKTRTKSNKNNILTPQEILRNQLIERDRYEPTRIDKAMGEMWDKGLQYDEFNAVLDYLESCDSRRSDVIINVGVKSDVDVDIDGRNNIKEGDTKVPEPESSSPSQQSDGGGSDKDKEKDNNNCDVITFKNSNEDEDEKEEESQQTKSPITMTTRLAMVAEFEDLTDAILALTQWVKKAATLEEIEDLCRAEKTSALSTIVRRGISSTEVVTDPTTVETCVVQPGLVELLVSVLHRYGVELDNGGERMKHMLTQARQVSLMGATGEQDDFEAEEAENDVTEQVATFIVSRIGLLMMTMTQKNC